MPRITESRPLSGVADGLPAPSAGIALDNFSALDIGIPS